MIYTSNDFKVSQEKKVKFPSNMKLVTSFVIFECQPCVIFEMFSYNQEDESIDPNIFTDTAGLGDRTKNLFSSDFMRTVSPFSVIFYTKDTYSCSSNKGNFVNFEDKTFSRKLKGIAKGLEIYGYGIVEYSVRSESGHMIALWDQAYYVPGLPKDLRIISPQGISTSEGYKGTFINHFHDEYNSYAELILKKYKPGWQKDKPVERFYVKYD